MTRLTIFAVLFFFHSLHGNLLVKINGIENKEGSGTVKFSLENKSEQGIKVARAWIFLFDEEGKVVGNHAQWIIDGKDEKKSLLPEKKQTFTSKVKSKGKIAKAQITFSRIVLADGTIPSAKDFVKTE